jgi:mannitol/fructose-specific phosphotransferase system IIA component (Ntr-type)
VEWGALDGDAVRTVVLLAVRESDTAATHMRVLASLARRMMHEEFRVQVEQEQDPAALCRLLHEEKEQ